MACLFFHIAGTWSLPLIDRDEPRFAEAAREMRQRGDYIVPYFNDEYRFDKPPLTNWFQTLSYRAFGENDFAARFPSAIAAALTAVLLLAWGRRLEDERAGWWAAIIFTLCLQTFMHAKAAVADMWLVLFVTAAHWAGYELIFRRSESKHSTSDAEHQSPHAIWWWTFYVTLAFGFLAKGPIGWTPLVTLMTSKLFLQDKRDARFSFITGTIITFAGIVLMLTIISLWGIPALVRTHGEFFYVGIGRHVIGRSVATMEGHGANSLGAYLLTLPFYFVTIFVSFFPWSIKLPWLARKLWRHPKTAVGDRGYNGRDATDNYLIVGAAIIFLVFTLVKTKLPHYTLPAFPLLALLLARHWSRQGASLSEAPTATESRPSQFQTLAAITAAAWLAIALFVFPFVARFFPSVQLFNASKNDLLPEMQFGAVSYNEPSLVWYFRSRVYGFLESALKTEDVPSFMKESGVRFVVVPTSLARKLYPALPPEWKAFPIQGFNIAKGRQVDLTLILKPREN